MNLLNEYSLLQLFAEGSSGEGGATDPGGAPEAAHPVDTDPTAGTSADPAGTESGSLDPADAGEEPGRLSRSAQFVLNQVRLWDEQANRAKELYPGLDLAAELRSPEFYNLLRSGVDVEGAYLLVHRHEILGSAMRHAARVARQQLSSAISSGAARPLENPVTGQGGTAEPDIAHMSRRQRDAIRTRAARGEKIRF